MAPAGQGPPQGLGGSENLPAFYHREAAKKIINYRQMLPAAPSAGANPAATPGNANRAPVYGKILRAGKTLGQQGRGAVVGPPLFSNLLFCTGFGGAGI